MDINTGALDYEFIISNVHSSLIIIKNITKRRKNLMLMEVCKIGTFNVVILKRMMVLKVY